MQLIEFGITWSIFCKQVTTFSYIYTNMTCTFFRRTLAIPTSYSFRMVLAVQRQLQTQLIKTPNNLSAYNSDINVVICKFFKNISTYFPYSIISRMYNIHSVALTCLDESSSSVAATETFQTKLTNSFPQVEQFL